MASGRQASWTEIFRNCLSRSRTPSSSPSSPVIDNPVPTGITSTQAAPTSNISLAPVNRSVPHAATQQSPAISALKTVLGKLQSSLNGLPPLQLAVGGLLECVVHLQVEEQNHQAFEDLATDLARLATLLQKHVVDSNPPNVPYSIANVARAISEQTKVINEHQESSKLSRVVSALDAQEMVLNCYQRIGALFQQLQMDVSLSIWDAVQEEQMDTRLNDLLPVHEAHYDAALPIEVSKRVGCTKGTRTALLDDTMAWTRQAGSVKICWLNGMAGTGKTTIAFTLCEKLYKGNQLGGSFFCSRNSPDCRDVNKIVPTIAYQLGRYSNPYRQALCNMLKGDRDIAKRNINTQFEQLISKPLMQVSKAMPSDVIIVIDALDECTDVRGTKDVLEMLLRHASDLPIKFFIASRPEPTILERMTSGGGPSRSILKLHDIEKSLVQADIKLYLAEALQSVKITPTELDTLVDRAGSLFIFAATAARYIVPDDGPVDHRTRLLTVLELQSSPENTNKSHEDIDRLYKAILSKALDANKLEGNELAQRRQVLWTVVCAREPLTISALAEILHMAGDEAVQLAIQPLQSVLHVSETTQVVSTFHASFPDFLLNKKRAEEFHCDEAPQNAYLSECCFGVMGRLLRFNICGLQSSYQLDSEVADLESRVDKAISAGLFYSCFYWGDHLTRSPPLPSLVLLLDSFMRRRLLFWLEVLNLKKQVGHADGVSGQALAWLPTDSSMTDLRDFIWDARNFIITFASNPVSLSTPHIYISALPFTSTESRMRASYWPKLRGLIRVDGDFTQAEATTGLATWVVGGGVYCMAQSSDGKLVAVGSSNFSYHFDKEKFMNEAKVSVWDISRGACISGPLQGHGECVLSVSFSPDNTRLASGSSNHTIRIWDMSSGTTIIAPLEGHTSDIYSFAFSPTGLYLASGFDDRTIRLWNADSGAPFGEPLQGHQGAVRSVSFSPDGKHLASGSEDCTTQVWDFLTGTTARGPMTGHTGAVYSIAYSRDGLRLASGSDDRTVRVWNMSDGTLLAGPFEGHTQAVKSVSFSPDGDRVASSSDDCTIRVWDAASGNLLAGPIEGHKSAISSVLFTMDGTRILSGSHDETIRVWDTRHRSSDANKPLGHSGFIYSVALSPNGTHVASGSEDRTICVWDTRDGTLVAGPFKGHTSHVTSVAFSPDGARIVSGSGDHTLRIWDAFAGVLLVGPIEGHTKRVNSVAFSPDGSLIASGSGDQTVRLWDSHTGKSVAKPFEHKTRVNSIAFSPDGARIASGCELPPTPSRRRVRSITDGTLDNALGNSDNGDLGDDADTAVGPTVRMWHATNCSAPIWASRTPTNPVSRMAFSPDGTRLVFASYSTILVLDAGNGAVLHGPFESDQWIYSMAFSPDGTRVVSGSDHRTVCVWDVETGTMVAGPLKGHTDGVNSVAFSLDGQRIISGSFDGTIRIWDLAGIARASATSSDDWSIDRDGWLTDSRSRRLFWVPCGLHRGFGFLTASNPIVINADCTARIDDATLLGDRWSECYDASFDAASP